MLDTRTTFMPAAKAAGGASHAKGTGSSGPSAGGSSPLDDLTFGSLLAGALADRKGTARPDRGGPARADAPAAKPGLQRKDERRASDRDADETASVAQADAAAATISPVQTQQTDPSAPSGAGTTRPTDGQEGGALAGYGSAAADPILTGGATTADPAARLAAQSLSVPAATTSAAPEPVDAAVAVPKEVSGVIGEAVPVSVPVSQGAAGAASGGGSAVEDFASLPGAAQPQVVEKEFASAEPGVAVPPKAHDGARPVGRPVGKALESAFADGKARIEEAVSLQRPAADRTEGAGIHLAGAAPSAIVDPLADLLAAQGTTDGALDDPPASDRSLSADPAGLLNRADVPAMASSLPTPIHQPTGDASPHPFATDTPANAQTPAPADDLLARNMQRLAAVVHSALGRFQSVTRMQLQPPELGAVTAVLQLRQNRMDLKLEVVDEIARTLVTGGLDRLRDSLQQQGIHLDRAIVSVAPRNEHPGGDSQQSAWSGQPHAGSSGQHGSGHDGQRAGRDVPPALMTEAVAGAAAGQGDWPPMPAALHAAGLNLLA